MLGITESNLVVLIANPYADIIAASLAERFENMKIIKTTTDSKPDEDISKVDVVVSWFPLQKVLPLIEDLKWFQVISAGYDHILDAGSVRKGTKFTHAGGVAAEPVSEMAIAFMLGLVKRFPESFRNKQKHIFPGAPGEEGLGPTEELNGKTAGILGAGYIGRAIARKAKAFDMKVLGYDKYVKEADNFEKIYSIQGLDELLANSDFVVIALPQSAETKSLIGESEFQKMKKGAYLINVARGDIVDKKAFLTALMDGWIAGGAIDVFWGDDPAHMFLEPEDELWDIPNLIISPHNAAFTPKYLPRFCEMFNENMKRFMSGETLLNLVALE